MKDKKYGIFIVLLAIVGTFAAVEHKKAREYEIYLENGYSRAFYDATQYVDDIGVSLAKSTAVNDPYHLAKLSSKISQYAQGAASCIAQLPQTDEGLLKTAKFLSQVGDYTYSLSLKHIDGTPHSKEETKRLMELAGYAKNLAKDLDELRASLDGKTISYSQVKSIGDEEESSVFSGMAELENVFQEIPSLIYDGPFSDHLESKTPKMLIGKEEASEETAYERLRRLLKKKAQNVALVGKSEGNIPVYYFSGTFEGEQIDAEISRKGAFVVNMLISRPIGDLGIALGEAKEKSKAFLEEQNILGMKESYYEVKNGIATINYAYEKDGVTIYPDLIKIKVAMDNGEIIGMETSGYLANHDESRVIHPPKITEDEALLKVSDAFYTENITRALIPTETKGEVSCYEIKGKMEDVTYLVYVNCETARVENVLMLMENEDGILTL